MSRNIYCIALLGPVLLIACLPAQGQTKPATSGKVSFNEPELRRHRSGFKRPQHPRRGTSLRELRR